MNDDAPDAVLLTRHAGGDSSALGELARRYEGPLLGLSRGLLRGREDLAREAVQETWLRVIRFAKHFDGRAQVRTWLYRIAINRCTDIRNREFLPLNGVPRIAETKDPDSIGQLRHVVERLPDAQRLVLLLCYHRGLTHEHAADVLNIPVGTLKTRLHAALESLRAAMRTEPTS